MKWIAGFLCFMGIAVTTSGEDLKIGLIGLDTSHVTAFTQLFNDPNDAHHVAGGRVVAAVKGGSRDIESSRSRVDEYTRQLQEKYGVQIVDSVEELCAKVDRVMIESVDGRPHLEQVKPVIKAGKAVFIDKPVAGTLHDTIEIYRMARENKVPVFSASAYRYYESMVDLQKMDVGEIRAAISYGPAHLEPHHPDLYWYGIHATEALFTILGPGIESVSRVSTPDTDVVTGVWSNGRMGTLVGLRAGPLPHKVTVFGAKKTAEQASGRDDYAPLVREIMKFFQTGISPVPPEDTLAIYAFMEAADESKRHGGLPVRIEDVLAKNGN